MLVGSSPRVLFGVTHTGGTESNTVNTYIAISVQTGRKCTNGRRLDIQTAEELDSDYADVTDSARVSRLECTLAWPESRMPTRSFLTRHGDLLCRSRHLEADLRLLRVSDELERGDNFDVESPS